MSLKKGDPARLIQPTVQGEVKGRRINDETDQTELLLGWTDAAGDYHERWFAETELEAA